MSNLALRIKGLRKERKQNWRINFSLNSAPIKGTNTENPAQRRKAVGYRRLF